MAQPGVNQCQESSGQIFNHKSNALPPNYPSFPKFHTECVLCLSPLKALHTIWEFWLAAEQAPPSLFHPSLHTRMHAHTHTHTPHARTHNNYMSPYLPQFFIEVGGSGHGRGVSLFAVHVQVLHSQHTPF